MMKAGAGMLHLEDSSVRKHLLKGNFGLEKESLRVLEDGSFAHSLHPFPDDAHIVKDFCENQTEINTGVHQSAGGAIDELIFHDRRIAAKLSRLSPREYLWPFSNPPHIKNESDVPVAIFEGESSSKTAYRNYLSDKYGRYKMTFSGIHVNYSFADELLQADYNACGTENNTDFRSYKDSVYLELAKGLVDAGWILVAVTAASPVLDASYLEKNVYGHDLFIGMASVRCSEFGYWNEFAPLLDYSNTINYAASIRKYVENGLLKAPSELYYPIRLKPSGENSLDSLEKNGINHIELRMFDINPLAKAGVDERDVIFAQLLMIWIISTPVHSFDERSQVNAVHNYKNAAHYDLKTVRIITPYGSNTSLADAAIMLIDEMKVFYRELGIEEVADILEFEYSKFTDADNRYAWKIRKLYSEHFAQKAMELAKSRQASALQIR